ncbi:MAG: hypothetical protein ACK5LZ_05580 [Anaerorhabdus sp.]
MIKKLCSVLLLLVLVTSCSTGNSSENDIDIKVLSPKGAPALSMVTYAAQNEGLVDFVDGADLLQAAFLNPTPEYQVIVAPVNLGGKLATLEKTEYKLAGIVTWGNLYFVAANEDALTDGMVLAAFGEGSVPGLLLESLQDDLTLEIVYYNSVVDAQAALLSGKADVALLAEPAATATISKSITDESIDELMIVGDVQAMVEEKLGGYGYPQAGIFVLESFYTKYPEMVDDFLIEVSESINNPVYSDLFDAVEMLGADEVGVSESVFINQLSSEEVPPVFGRMNVYYKDATDVKVELENFLNLFGIEISEQIYLK